MNSTSGWNYTSIALAKGEQFSVSHSSGSWSVDYRNHPYVGPGGYSAPEDANIYQGCKMDSSIVYGKLLGIIGGQLFVIGGGGTFTSPASGTLGLRIHDGDQCLADNAGSVRVAVTTTTS